MTRDPFHILDGPEGSCVQPDHVGMPCAGNRLTFPSFETDAETVRRRMEMFLRPRKKGRR